MILESQDILVYFQFPIGRGISVTQGVTSGSWEVGSQRLRASFPDPLPWELGAVLGLLYSGEVLAGEAASRTA